MHSYFHTLLITRLNINNNHDLKKLIVDLGSRKFKYLCIKRYNNSNTQFKF